MPILAVLNACLDKLVRPEIRIHRRFWPAFQVCGCIGLGLATLLTIILVTHLSLSVWVMIGLTLAAVLTFLALVMATKIITSEENIIYYHHEIAVILVSALMLWFLDKPLLPYLDVVILGIGAFLICGRVGCAMVGCCHGRPLHWGVCYRQEHATAGFTPYLVGVRLFPVQAAESLWVLVIVIVGAGLIFNGHQPGEALAWYVITYDLGRFCFEFGRGDPDRPYYRGFSQQQWISVILMIGVSWAEWVEILPFHAWHTGVTITLIFGMIFVVLKRRFQATKKYLLLHPRHIKEIAEAIQIITGPGTEGDLPRTLNVARQNIQLIRTSLGVQISAGLINDGAGNTHHFALSSQSGMMTEEAARIVANLILKLKYHSIATKLTYGNQGIFHLLIPQVNGYQPCVEHVRNTQESGTYKI